MATGALVCEALQTVLNDDRLFPPDPATRQMARELYAHTRSLPIVSPHGHCDPAALADDLAYPDLASELVTKDHYLLRLLYSHGVQLESLGVEPLDGSAAEADGRRVWRRFADHYHLFRGTPSKLWLDHTLCEVLQVQTPLRGDTADDVYDQVAERLTGESYRPQALYQRFGIEFLATTDGALDSLDAHDRLRKSGWPGRMVPTFRPDDVVDPERPGFHQRITALGELTGEDTSTWTGYLSALRARRATFVNAGATASDHGHPTAATADLSRHDAERLFHAVTRTGTSPADAELFRAQMLFEMASMSVDDGLVMQLHTGAWRDHNLALAARFGPDIGSDIPRSVDYVAALKPLLDRFGNETSLTLIVYTLDEATYSRELAPLAGHYPALRLGPPWWFHDSPEGIRRFYQLVSETAGFANTVGFNDDARSLLTIPARHDVARRLNAGHLAGLVVEHRLADHEALDIAEDLAYRLAQQAFRAAP